MYALQDVKKTLTRLKMLRCRLEMPDAKRDYDQEHWTLDCGSPSCGLGFSTTLFPDEITIFDFKVVGIKNPITGIPLGAYVYGFSIVYSRYVFADRDPLEQWERDPGEITGPNTLHETYRRLDKLIAYYTRKVQAHASDAAYVPLLRPVRYAKRILRTTNTKTQLPM